MTQDLDVRRALYDSHLASILGEGEVDTVCELLAVTEFEAGEVFVARGEPATSVGLLVAGSAEVILGGQRVGVLEKGQLFGESMFSSDGARTADLRALTPGRYAALTSESFQLLLHSHRQIALRCQRFFEAEYAKTRDRDARAHERDETRYLALIAHDEMKSTLVDFARRNRERLVEFPLVATGTTGTLIHQETGIVLHRKVRPGPLGGDQAIGAMISTGDVLAVIFFRDPLSAHPHHADIEALGRLCDVYHVPFATNPSTAEAVLDYLEHGGARSALGNPVLDGYHTNEERLVRGGD